MVHDDDTGRPPHNKFDYSHDPGDDPTGSWPAHRIVDQIIRLVRENGWAEHEISRSLHYAGSAVSPQTVRRVIARARMEGRLP